MRRSVLSFRYGTLLTIFVCIGGLFLSGCSDSGSGQSYDFSSAANASISRNVRSPRFGNVYLENLNEFFFPHQEDVSRNPTLCSSVICFTPTALTGTYYGTGLLIQSGGNGMTAYFGQSTWSQITGDSPSYSFDIASPVTNTGNLTCCNGTGDLTSSNTYISDAIYLFGYLDATFTVSGVTSNTNMNRAFTVRFVLADGAISGGLRGDVLIKDPTGGATFYWIDTSVSAGGDVGAGTLSSTRPTTPVTLNTSVVDYTNPFGTSQGNQTIPVIYAGVLPSSGTGVVTITETELRAANKTYTYKFDPTGFVMFPATLTADINDLSSYTALLQKIHIAGLPHSGQPQGVGSPDSTVLEITSR